MAFDPITAGMELGKKVLDMLTPWIPDPAAREKAAQQMTGLLLEEKRIDAADRDSARKREMEVKDATPARLAFLIVGAFIAVAVFVVAHPYIWPGTKLEPEMLGMVGAVIGYLSAKAEQVASYYFGSSAGSQAKDLTIGKMAGK